MRVEAAAGVLIDGGDADFDPLTASLVNTPPYGAVTLEPDGSFTGSKVATVRISVSLDMPRMLRDNLRITEMNYNPYEVTPEEQAVGVKDRDAFEFIELQNTGGETLDLDGVQLSGGVRLEFVGETLLDPGEFALVVKDRSAFETRCGAGLKVVGEYAGELWNRGEQIALKDPFDQTILDFSYRGRDGWPRWANGFGGTLEAIDPEGDYGDGDNWQTSVEYGGTPGVEGMGHVASVAIDEVLSHTDFPLTDWIELYHATDTDIDIGGWYLSDDIKQLRSFRIPEGTVILPGGYVVFDEHDFNPQRWGQGLGGFALDGPNGDDVWLTAADAEGNFTRFADHVKFGPTRDGVSLGRWPTHEDELSPMQTLTLGDPNTAARTGLILINEVMYNPPVSGTGIDPNDLEFIEIYNTTDETLDTTSWRIRGGVRFDFPYRRPTGPPPSNAILVDAGETLVGVGFDVNDSAQLDAFRQYNAIDGSVQIVGPYRGSLNDGGDTVQLIRPVDPNPDEPHRWVYALEDEVSYDDAEPWPASPDGLGPEPWLANDAR